MALLTSSQASFLIRSSSKPFYPLPTDRHHVSLSLRYLSSLSGPLGQGIANVVGLALVEKHLAAKFNKPDCEIVTITPFCRYSIPGDGCQMEGIANEACSLARHWGLGRLIAFYDNNHISINGLGWHVIWVKNGNTWFDEIRAAIKEAKAVKEKPTLIKNTPKERNLRFGVRKYIMRAICNGITCQSPGLIPYCATFFVLKDYMRAAIRLSALSQAGVIYVMTHASIGLGENGPTHQPIEHVASFRAMPNILMLRPADEIETAGAYKVGVENRMKPSILALSKQKLPHLPRTSVEGVEKGDIPDVIMMGTWSELEIAAKAGEKLREEGRVVSLVSWELFVEQSEEYKESVLPSKVSARVSIEGRSTFGFGASAPTDVLYKKFGLSVDAVVAAAKVLC
ncbi:hypothetical protein CARUB_v10002554mg [Capsella rubella]|uniref:Transketolase-like pyrimidine-binding domain-containing protein n=1 Tax=Capsella rubella TaxID=81985 RepID=R0GYR4_9BRAS|nr:hypothetical protein CARUB_v10002554mg [Capsella rubella]